MESIILDIITVAVVLLCMVTCYRNGLINSVVRLLGWVVAIAVSSAMSQPVAAWVYDSFLHGRILRMVEEQVRAFASPDELIANVEAFIAQLPAGLSGLVQINGMDMAEWITSLTGQVAFPDLADAIVNAAITPVMIAILGICAFFVMFSLLGILVRFVASAMKLVNKVPVVGRINALLGAVIGVCQGLVLVYLMAIALHLGVLLTGDGLSFIRERDATNAYLFSYFYELGYRVEYPISFN